jgi:Xaa-Pro aminopeptidase
MPGVTRLDFEASEYAGRRNNVKVAMTRAGFDLLVLCDPANMDYLTGYKGWSFYVPQAVLVHVNEEKPVWIGRGQDAAAAHLTTDLPAAAIVPYPDDYVQNRTKHPMNFVADYIRGRGWQRASIGLEADAHYFSMRAGDAIRADLPDARFRDCEHLVNWVRIVKSDAEIAYMRDAARLVEGAMRIAIDRIAPGVRQCDAVADIYHAQVKGTSAFGGDYTAICPLLPTGEGAGTPHLTWSDAPFRTGEATIIELAGSRKGYHCPMARTVHLGKPPQQLADTAKVVAEGLQAALAAARPCATCQDVEAGWRAVISRRGIVKDSRIGYSIGIGYPPDWGEQTASLRPGDKTMLQPNMTFHCIPGIWQDGWGIEISAAFVVTPTGAQRFSSFADDLVTKT